MKRSFIIIALICLLGCSPAGQRIIERKISTVEHRKQVNRKITMEETMQQMARSTAASFSKSGERPIKVWVYPLACPSKSQSLNNYLDELYRQFLVQESGNGRFYLLTKQQTKSDSVSGSPLIEADVDVTPTCTRMNSNLYLSFKIIEKRSLKVEAVLSGEIKIDEITWDNDFLLFPYRIYDSATGLHWQRSSDSINLTYDAAVSYCSGLIIDGFNNWRLPASEELFGLISRPIDNKATLFGFSYGYIWQEQGCHWFEREFKSISNPIAVNVESGEYIYPGDLKRFLKLSRQTKCRVKCVRQEELKIPDPGKHKP